MAQDEGTTANHYKKEKKRPKWLVMIYCAGDNNLSANTIAIMQQLEETIFSKDVRVLACFDPNTPRPRGARYVEIIYRRKNHPNPKIDWALHDDLVPFEDLPGHPVQAPDFCENNPSPERPTTEPTAREGLARFLQFALDHHRADKHMLILFGHGSAVAGNTFLADNNPPSFLRLKEFREVLSRFFDAEDEAENAGTEGKPKKPALDILACDNCMMNGIESAYEIRRQVKYVIGSQGLVLALGWPFRKIINEIVRHRKDDPKHIAERILRICARNLIDFSLMDRSSEQSFCDLTTLTDKVNLVTAVKRLSRAMQDGLVVDDCGDVKYAPIRDAIWLARLEAQSFWSETFVDLYDFCELLLRRSIDALSQFYALYQQSQLAVNSEQADSTEGELIFNPRAMPIFEEFGKIANACWLVLDAIKANQEVSKEKRRRFVLASYYVGPQLQYSNGVSIYFPWTLPEDPIIFDSVTTGGGGGGGNYLVSWAEFDRTQKILAAAAAAGNYQGPSQDFQLKTAFDEYQSYEFAMAGGGDWTAFLKVFFRATLRNVRRFDLRYVETSELSLFFDTESIEDKADFLDVQSPINLQKSSSDADSEMDYPCPTIKNYPRRFYLSPADCRRRCPPPPRTDENCHLNLGKVDKKICVSYLGWNIRGFVAEAIKLKEKLESPETADDSLEGMTEES